MTSPDKPLVLRGGDDEQTAMFNRIAVYERLKFLTGGIDARNKSVDYWKYIDLELWQRWYKHTPNVLPDEEFCRRAAEVILAMEGKEIKLNEEAYEKAVEEFHVDQNTRVRRGNVDEAQQVEDRVCEDNPPPSDSGIENKTGKHNIDK